jgi:hypothetical protein
MGCYINPPDTTKEQWLERHGVRLDTAPQWCDVPGGCLAVCLVSNGYFSAAAVCHDPRELETFKDPRDLRPKSWFMVEIAELATVSPIKEYFKGS